MDEIQDEADDFETEESLTDVFRAATDHVRQISAQLDGDKLLYFYARYKQVSEGPCSTPKPGMFDFQGKQKWEAWHELGGKNKTEAMLEYVSLLSNLRPGWQQTQHSTQEGQAAGGDHALRERTRTGMGVAVSTMVCADDALSDRDKTVFHWCQEGNVERVRQIVTARADPSFINQLDTQGIGLLHWASDRGLVDMATMLLDSGANINLQDSEGQTALHYAVSCEHEAMVQLLLLRGADMSLADNDGSLPMDVASDDMKTILKGHPGMA